MTFCPSSRSPPLFDRLQQLATPILTMLDGSPNAWLGSMMQAFNKGDIDAFNQLCAENQEVTLITFDVSKASAIDVSVD